MVEAKRASASGRPGTTQASVIGEAGLHPTGVR